MVDIVDWISGQSIVELDAYASFLVNAGLIVVTLSSAIVASFVATMRFLSRKSAEFSAPSGPLGIGVSGWIIIIIVSITIVAIVAKIAAPPSESRARAAEIAREDGRIVAIWGRSVRACKSQGLKETECMAVMLKGIGFCVPELTTEECLQTLPPIE